MEDRKHSSKWRPAFEVYMTHTVRHMFSKHFSQSRLSSIKLTLSRCNQWDIASSFPFSDYIMTYDFKSFYHEKDDVYVLIMFEKIDGLFGRQNSRRSYSSLPWDNVHNYRDPLNHHLRQIMCTEGMSPAHPSARGVASSWITIINTLYITFWNKTKSLQVGMWISNWYKPATALQRLWYGLTETTGTHKIQMYSCFLSRRPFTEL